jgi:hypothetical protein
MPMRAQQSGRHLHSESSTPTRSMIDAQHDLAISTDSRPASDQHTPMDTVDRRAGNRSPAIPRQEHELWTSAYSARMA